MSKPGKSLKALCKRLKVRLTIKRNGKRVYKSIKVLKDQCAKKRKVKKKKVKRKRRRRKFGSGPEVWSTKGSANAPDPFDDLHNDSQDSLILHSPGSSPNNNSPFILRRRNRERRTGIRADTPLSFSLDSPLSPILPLNEEETIPSRRLQGLFNSLPRGESVNRRLFQYSKKNKKVKKRRKFGSLPITPPTVKKKDRRNSNVQFPVIQYPVLDYDNIDPNLMDRIEQITNDETLYDDFWEPSTNANRRLVYNFGKKKKVKKRRKVVKKKKVKRKKVKNKSR
jgi:hypothetical protein